MKSCETHGGVADTRNLHLPQVMPTLTQSGDFEPEGIELDRNPGKDLQPRRIELDRNIGTGPYQIPERILGDVYQNPTTEDTEEIGNFGDDMPYVQSRMHSIQLKALQTRILKMENYEKCWPHSCMHMGEENTIVLLKDP